MNLLRCIRERFLSWECFINGSAYENSKYWEAYHRRLRGEYALANPWVLDYDFGHREILLSTKPNTVI